MRESKEAIRNHPAIHGRGAGFSLLEVLIAMAIFTVGLLALAQMQIVAMQNNQRSTIRTDGANVAQETMERVINAEWADLAGLAGTQPTVTRHGISYSPNIILETPSANMRVVRVQVSWNDGKARTYELSTRKSQAEDPKT